MDQWVIHSIKVHNRRRIVRLCIETLDKNKPLPNTSIIQTMKDLVFSWNSVSKEIIIKCFKKAVISSSRKQLVVTDAGDNFKTLTEDLSHLWEIEQNSVQEVLSAESFINLDNNVVIIASISSGEDIVDEISDPEEDDEIDEDTDDIDAVVENSNWPSNIESEEALDKLYNISLFRSSYGRKIQSLCLKNGETFLQGEIGRVEVMLWAFRWVKWQQNMRN